MFAPQSGACTHVTSHPTLYCCRPSLMGDSTNATTSTTHCALKPNKNTARLTAQTRTFENVRSPAQYERTFKHSLPAVEDSVRSPPASVLLRASSRADTKLCKHFSHNACRTATRQSNLSPTTMTVVLVSVRLCFSSLPQGLGLATGARLTDDRLCPQTCNTTSLTPLPPCLERWLGRLRCQSKSTSGGLHLLSPTFVISMKVHSPPSSPLRSVNSAAPSRTAASGQSTLNLDSTMESTTGSSPHLTLRTRGCSAQTAPMTSAQALQEKARGIRKGCTTAPHIVPPSPDNQAWPSHQIQSGMLLPLTAFFLTTLATH